MVWFLQQTRITRAGKCVTEDELYVKQVRSSQSDEKARNVKLEFPDPAAVTAFSTQHENVTCSTMEMEDDLSRTEV